MSQEKEVQIINRINDQKLRDLMLTYRSVTSPAILLEILDYLDVKIVTEKIGAIIPRFKAESLDIGYKIDLGGIIIDGTLYQIHYVAYDDGEAYISMYRDEDMILYRQGTG